MNNAKMWLVVKPTVGVPLFLTAVAVGSFSVHLAVLRNTTWVPAFLQGKPKAKAASIEVPGGVPGSNAVVMFQGTDATGVVVLPDGRTARVTFDAPAQTAALLPGAK
ncbi:MAG: light-harvesting protein [Burkholderiales bacterium]|jgi:light-harvesting protein B-800-850 alpha chain|nr:light-harvesting protein [Burkholderiales bacterium]